MIEDSLVYLFYFTFPTCLILVLPGQIAYNSNFTKHCFQTIVSFDCFLKIWSTLNITVWKQPKVQLRLQRGQNLSPNYPNLSWGGSKSRRKRNIFLVFFFGLFLLLFTTSCLLFSFQLWTAGSPGTNIDFLNFSVVLPTSLLSKKICILCIKKHICNFASKSLHRPQDESAKRPKEKKTQKFTHGCSLKW